MENMVNAPNKQAFTHQHQEANVYLSSQVVSKVFGSIFLLVILFPIGSMYG